MPFQSDVYYLAGTGRTVQAYPSAVHSGAGNSANVAGPVASISVAAPAGAVSGDATILGQVATIAATGVAGTLAISSSVAGPAGAITTVALAGVVSAGVAIAGPATTITTVAPAGSAAAAAVVAGPAAAITLLARTQLLRMAMEYGEPLVRLAFEPSLALGVAEVLLTRGAGGPTVFETDLRTAMSVGVPQAGGLLESPTTPVSVSLADLVVGEPMTLVRTASVATRLSVGDPLVHLAVRPATDRNPSI